VYLRENICLMLFLSYVTEESQLIRELKKGSTQAFDKIFEKYFKRLYAYCYRFTKSKEDSEEIVQDVFLRLWNIRETIQQEDTLQSLLFIISKNYLINAFHKNIHPPEFEDYVDYQEKLSVEDTQRLEYEDFLQQLKLALSKLPKTQKSVIEKSRLEQKTNKEIADELSLSEQTVKNQLSLGLKTLRSLLRETQISIWFLIFDSVFRYFSD